MTDHRVCSKSSKTNDLCRAVSAYPFGAPEFIPTFSGFKDNCFCEDENQKINKKISVKG
jgi:hypothetical protein